MDKIRLDDSEFYNFCQENDLLSFERDSDGTIIRLLPGSSTSVGSLRLELNFQLRGWSKRSNIGHVFYALTAFRLPSTAIRSADAAFVTNERWEVLTNEQRKTFPPLCPDFIVELRSSTDSTPSLQRKIQNDWLAAGCRLAWLIDAESEQVYIYRADGSVQIIKSFDEPLTGEDVLPGLTFTLADLRLS